MVELVKYLTTVSSVFVPYSELSWVLNFYWYSLERRPYSISKPRWSKQLRDSSFSWTMPSYQRRISSSTTRPSTGRGEWSPSLKWVSNDWLPAEKRQRMKWKRGTCTLRVFCQCCPVFTFLKAWEVWESPGWVPSWGRRLPGERSPQESGRDQEGGSSTWSAFSEPWSFQR